MSRRRAPIACGLALFAVVASVGVTILVQQKEHRTVPRFGTPVVPGSFVGTWYDEQDNPTYFRDEQRWHLTLHVINGAEHCGWQSASYLTLAWPIGTDVSRLGEGARVYLRDPEGVFTGEFDVPPPDLQATLPADEAPTGYHRGPWELWLSPTDAADAACLVADHGTIERWPRADPVAYCA